jgi:hypothetical protein
MSEEEWQIDKPPTYVCFVEPFGANKVTVRLQGWPSLWRRFWMWVFFGWRFIAIVGKDK